MISPESDNKIEAISSNIDSTLVESNIVDQQSATICMRKYLLTTISIQLVSFLLNIHRLNILSHFMMMCLNVRF